LTPNSPDKGQQKQKDLMFHAAQKLCHMAGVKLTQFKASRKISITF